MLHRSLVVAICSLAVAASAADGPLGAFPPDDTLLLSEVASNQFGEMSVRVYSVADLVVSPIQEESTPGSVTIEASPIPSQARSNPGASGPSMLENLAELSVILQSVIDPVSWEMSGGAGHIAVHANSLSLIVRQTDAAHEQISDLLTDLRWCAATEVNISFELFAPRDAAPESDDGGADFAQILAEHEQALSADEARQLRIELTQQGLAIPRRRLLLSNGGSARVIGSISCLAVIASDRRTVQVQLRSLPGEENSSPRAEQHRIPDGRTILIPIGDPDDDFLLAMVSVGIVTPEEEEELLTPLPELDDPDPTPLIPDEQVADEDPFVRPVGFESNDAAVLDVYDITAALDGEIQLVGGKRRAKPKSTESESSDAEPADEIPKVADAETVAESTGSEAEENPPQRLPVIERILKTNEPVDQFRQQINAIERSGPDVLHLVERRRPDIAIWKERLNVRSLAEFRRLAARETDERRLAEEWEHRARLEAEHDRELAERGRHEERDLDERRRLEEQAHQDRTAADLEQVERERIRIERHLAEATEHLLAAGLPDLAHAVQEHARHHSVERLRHRLRVIEEQHHNLEREAEEIHRHLDELE